MSRQLHLQPSKRLLLWPISLNIQSDVGQPLREKSYHPLIAPVRTAGVNLPQWKHCPLISFYIHSTHHNMVHYLNLCSAYNLNCVHKGDKWKTPFQTPSEHYEYQVMPYGLANTPLVFQGFMNEIIYDFVSNFVLIYTDAILIYSSSLPEHKH